MNPIDQNAAQSYATRRVPRRVMGALLSNRDIAPLPGDLVLARVDRIGHHKRLHLPCGRRKQLFPGDEIILAYANRYAPRQYEAIVPTSLDPCHLVASGGIAGQILSKYSGIRGLTHITPLGLISEREGEAAINLSQWTLPPIVYHTDPSIPVIAIVGTTMDSGKTTTAAHLTRGLIRAGGSVGYAKITGTGAGGDPWLLVDAGAESVLDFTDVGHASTYLVPPDEIDRIFLTLLSNLRTETPDVIVIEIADGLLQSETSELIRGQSFRKEVNGLIFCSGDAMGASAGVAQLLEIGLPVLAIAGRLSGSPLQVREAEAATGLPVLPLADLSDPTGASKLLAKARLEP